MHRIFAIQEVRLRIRNMNLQALRMQLFVIVSWILRVNRKVKVVVIRVFIDYQTVYFPSK
jgi:hypothetical protein